MSDKPFFHMRERVRLSAYGLRRLGDVKGHDKTLRGLVIGFGPGPLSIRVLRDGLLHPDSYYYKFWEGASADP